MYMYRCVRIFYFFVYLSFFSYVDEIRADLISRKVGTALAGLTANFPENQVIDNHYYIDSAILLTLISFAVDNCCK